MVENTELAANITVLPATPDLWGDLAHVMGPKGGSGGCWCQLWRMPKAAYDAASEHERRANLQTSTEAGATAPGLLAYDGDVAVGWCSVAPRTDLPRLASSRVLKPVDDVAVWCVTCLLVSKTHRRRGISVALLTAAVTFARENGAPALEGYPVAPETEKYAPVFAWVGLERAFLQAGFREIARRSPTRPIMRVTF